MPYIGNNLATQFQAFATQTITGDGSTSYTLDRAVANGKELLVYINNVKQEEGSGKSYTASGTTITFSEAVASGDSCYLVYMGSAQQTVVPPDGSVSSAKLDTNIAVSGDLTVDTSTLKVDASNNRVGIGTASPSVPLSVQSDSNASAVRLLGRSADDYSELDFYEADNSTRLVRLQAHTSGFQIRTDTSAPLLFKTNNTLAQTIDANGHITQPLQSAFLVQPSSAQSNLAISTNHVVVFDTERFDQNGDFASNTFTAPVTGKYQFNVQLYLQHLDTDTSYYQPQLNTSNRTYYFIVSTNNHDADADYYTLNFVILTDMDANDTVNVTFPVIGGGSAQTDINTESAFSGYLVC